MLVLYLLRLKLSPIFWIIFFGFCPLMAFLSALLLSQWWTCFIILSPLYTRTHAHIHTCTRTLSLTLTHTNECTHTLSHSHTHKCMHMLHWCTFCLSLFPIPSIFRDALTSPVLRIWPWNGKCHFHRVSGSFPFSATSRLIWDKLESNGSVSRSSRSVVRKTKVLGKSPKRH